MTTGDNLMVFMAWGGSQPSVSGCSLSYIIGTTSIKEAFEVANFDDTTREYLDFVGVMPNYYDGGGLTCTIMFAHANNSSGPTWEIAFRRIADDAEDLDTTAHTYAYNTVAAGVPSAVGEVGYDDITFTDGSDMDSIAVGELFNMRVSRDPATGGSGDASLISILVKET